ncbi:MAG: gluconate 2-dehydrogenase subunit 3 family protein [Chloroflexi bacterium]|nr:gluconate 2-dehydrogenase subunit 3 family protein [Chloroflexota bacterium]
MELLDSHAAMVQAIADRILPADETAGGGSAECMIHIADVLGNEQTQNIDLLRMYLDKLNVTAKIRHRHRFIDITIEQQDALLTETENHPAFALLAELVHESYWASEAGQTTAGFEVRG